MSEKRQPWGKWYWGDWRKDARLRRCSYAARGLWADMLSLMGGECDAFGYLSMEGQPLVVSDLAGLLGGAERELGKLLDELEQKRVFSRVGDLDLPQDIREIVSPGAMEGTIISRRMLRDKAKEERDKRNGKSGGNPHLMPPDNEGVNPPDKAQKLEARSQKLEKDAPSGRERARGTRLPDDWQPDLTDRLFAEQLSLDPDEIAAKFRDYWHARAGAGGTKLDWPATWRTWCRREAEDRNRRGPHGSTARTNGSGRPANGFVELELEAQRRAEARDRGRDEHPADG